MMTETNNDCCYSNNDVDFCNGASLFYVVVKKNNKSCAYDRDCAYDYSSCETESPPETCPFSPQDIEKWERDGEVDIHTSDYIGEV